MPITAMATPACSSAQRMAGSWSTGPLAVSAAGRGASYFIFVAPPYTFIAAIPTSCRCATGSTCRSKP